MDIQPGIYGTTVGNDIFRVPTYPYPIMPYVAQMRHISNEDASNQDIPDGV